MNPLIAQQITTLQKSNDPWAPGQAAIMILLVEHADRMDDMRESIRSVKEDVKDVKKDIQNVRAVTDGVLAQTKIANGRTTKNENRIEKLEEYQRHTVSCPGKCIPLAEDVASLIPRIAALEEPVKAKAAVTIWLTSKWGMATAVITILCGLFAVPAISDFVLTKKQNALADQVLTKDDIVQILQDYHTTAPAAPTTPTTPASPKKTP